MVKGIRVVSVSKGYDPREFCLVAFGGAGPVHASELADEMDIPTVLVPVAPGVTSALGLLMADLRHDFAQTVLRPGSELSPSEITSWYEQLETQAMEQMAREDVAPEDVSLIRAADARYVGQGYELEVLVESGRARTARRRPDRGAIPRCARAHLRLRLARQRGRGRQPASYGAGVHAAARPRQRFTRRRRPVTRPYQRTERVFRQRTEADEHLQSNTAPSRRRDRGAGNRRAARLHNGRMGGVRRPPSTTTSTSS